MVDKGFWHRKRLERAMKTVIVMPQCKLSLMLVTPSYLKDYFIGEPDIVTQVRLSKQLNQPVILMLDRNLTPRKRKQADRIESPVGLTA